MNRTLLYGSGSSGVREYDDLEGRLGLVPTLAIPELEPIAQPRGRRPDCRWARGRG